MRLKHCIPPSIQNSEKFRKPLAKAEIGRGGYLKSRQL
jgi:hypothetical protein